ncbi:MAG: hypothetical protein COY80_02940 [Candidatus Pacebacteria bacterium CG_4_10_14_0_8_um_filter_42_14]|nr:MAG: hypothetical protein COY80_02940 [Candidatus Pacebacteria bacterium CG_4_10_14_0_8_um_filter_42_14]
MNDAQDPLKALEELIAKRKAGAPADDLAAAALVDPPVPLVDLEKLEQEARARDEISIREQQEKLKGIDSTPEYQARVQQDAAAAETKENDTDQDPITQLSRMKVQEEDLS